MSASKIQRRSGLKSWDTENMIQAIRAVCNKEMGYPAAAKNITCLILHYNYVSSNWDTFQATQSKLGHKPIIPPPLEDKLVVSLLLIERKYFRCT
jgi:hypothetical protein